MNADQLDNGHPQNSQQYQNILSNCQSSSTTHIAMATENKIKEVN